MTIDIINYKFSLYIFQQLISRLLYMKLYFQSPLFILFIGLSGIITGFSPCIVSTLPTLLIYLGLYNGKQMNIVFFLLGLIITQAIIMCIFGIIGYRYYALSIALPILSSVLYIVVGFIILQIFNVNITRVNLRLSFVSDVNIRNLVFGGLLALNTLPCVISIILTILNIILTSSNYVVIFLYSIVYLLGYICPILFLCFLIRQFRSSQAFKFFAINNLYKLLGGFFMLSSGVFKLLKIIFYSY